jgi:hypothetical protein
LSCDVVLQRRVPHRCAWCPRSLHTAEATGSKLSCRRHIVTPNSLMLLGPGRGGAPWLLQKPRLWTAHRRLGRDLGGRPKVTSTVSANHHRSLGERVVTHQEPPMTSVGCSPMPSAGSARLSTGPATASRPSSWPFASMPRRTRSLGWVAPDPHPGRPSRRRRPVRAGPDLAAVGLPFGPWATG